MYTYTLLNSKNQQRYLLLKDNYDTIVKIFNNYPKLLNLNGNRPTIAYCYIDYFCLRYLYKKYVPKYIRDLIG